jgi:glycosyltransferase involved in cell wall biosynthesis
VAHDVDVILPTHARPSTLPFAMRAVLGQSVRSLRLHIVGDGSDDATGVAVGTVADDRVTFRRLPKAPGFGYANRNCVLRETSAPFVAYASDDDLWLPDHLETALAAMKDGPFDFVATPPAAVYPPDELDPYFFAFDWKLGPFSAFLRYWFLGAPGFVHRRSAFERIGYWDESLPRFGDRDIHDRARRALAYGYIDRVTVIRFYARHWSPLYASLAQPPQSRYLELLQDPAWIERFRARASSRARGASVRYRQVTDFLRFAIGSGPGFIRYRLGRAPHRDGSPH